MINGGLTTPSPKRKHATSTPDHPLKRRKLVRLARIKGRLENSQGDNNQPVEIDDSWDEQPPQLEGEENEKGMQGNEKEKWRKKLRNLSKRRKQNSVRATHFKIH